MLGYVVNLVSYVYDSVLKTEKEELFYGLRELYCSTKSIFNILDQFSLSYLFDSRIPKNEKLTEKEKITEFLSSIKSNIELIEFFILDLASNLSNVEINYEMVSHKSNICLIYETSYQKKPLFTVDTKRNIIIVRKIKFVRSKLCFEEKTIQFNSLQDVVTFSNNLKKDLNTLKEYRLKMKQFMLERYKLEDLF